ncbi:hypothetical protein Glove_251g30 [Diversispora epigaea]|uniref:Uncharacterized protein n=1 Tax=Diversispora epigaea TaxID=1348612 RepID=A0A397IFL1_9GLOM|nr:hypothetical protein Glove_251g30 [Diversispora epigaea]
MELAQYHFSSMVSHQQYNISIACIFWQKKVKWSQHTICLSAYLWLLELVLSDLLLKMQLRVLKRDGKHYLRRQYPWRESFKTVYIDDIEKTPNYETDDREETPNYNETDDGEETPNSNETDEYRRNTKF